MSSSPSALIRVLLGEVNVALAEVGDRIEPLLWIVALQAFGIRIDGALPVKAGVRGTLPVAGDRARPAAFSCRRLCHEGGASAGRPWGLLSSRMAHSTFSRRRAGQVEVEHRLVLGQGRVTLAEAPVQHGEVTSRNPRMRRELLALFECGKRAWHIAELVADDAEHLPRDRITVDGRDRGFELHLRRVDLAPRRERLAVLAMREADARRRAASATARS